MARVGCLFVCIRLICDSCQTELDKKGTRRASEQECMSCLPHGTRERTAFAAARIILPGSEQVDTVKTNRLQFFAFSALPYRLPFVILGSFAAGRGSTVCFDSSDLFAGTSRLNSLKTRWRRSYSLDPQTRDRRPKAASFFLTLADYALVSSE